MQRRKFTATVVTESGLDEIGSKQTFAWNSAIKATEAIMREYARNEGCIYEADKPRVMEAGAASNNTKIYRRQWTNTNAGGKTFTAMVWEIL